MLKVWEIIVMLGRRAAARRAGRGGPSVIWHIPPKLACGGTFFHLHGYNNQVMICRPCNDQRILELECALEAALKTVAAIEERKAK